MKNNIYFKMHKLLLALTVLNLFFLIGWQSNVYSCTDSAGICQNDFYQPCMAQWSACLESCNSFPSEQTKQDCIDNCNATYSDNNQVSGCTAQYNQCMQSCPWKVTSIAGAGGSISSTGVGGSNSTDSCGGSGCLTYLPGYVAGQSQTYSVNPNYCYQIADVIVDGSSIGPVTPYSFYVNGTTTEIHSISASFGINSYTVTPSAGPNGSISPSVPQTVNCGSTKSFGVIPAAHYHITSVTGCGGTLIGTNYTTNGITANCTVNAAFAIDTYTVTPSAGAHGSISPSGPQTVNYGSTKSFTITPNTGYHISSVGGTCGGTLNGNTYTTNAVTANCTVSATFLVDPPIADFSANVVSGVVPFAVNFTDLSTNNPTAWVWNFGDGQTSTLKNPTHAYTSVGPFTVTVTASNAGGSDSATKTNYINTTACASSLVKLVGSPSTYYSTIQAAYNDATNGAVIQVLGLTLGQSLNANLDKSITLEGGKSCDFTSTVNSTSLQGMITTSLGTLIISDFDLVN